MDYFYDEDAAKVGCLMIKVQYNTDTVKGCGLIVFDLLSCRGVENDGGLVHRKQGLLCTSLAWMPESWWH